MPRHWPTAAGWTRQRKPWEPLSIRTSAALTDAKFKKYPDAPAPRGHGSSQDLSGKRLPYAPEQQVSATPEVRIPFTGPELPFFGSHLLFVGALDVQYIGGL